MTVPKHLRVPRSGEPAAEAEPRKPLARVSARKVADGRAVEGSTLRRTAGPKPTRRKQRPGGRDAGGDWRQACLLRNAHEHDGYPVDEFTGEPLRADWQCHHVLEATHLNAAGFGGSEFVLWHVDNGMCLNEDTHRRHHSYTERIWRSCIRDYTWAFARMLDDTQGTGAFTARLERDYPEET